jgi:ArsR family transcriptional regulator
MSEHRQASAAGGERAHAESDALRGQRPLYQVKADFFKGLAHPVRIRVLELLSSAEERTVAELLDETGLEPSHLSQHLAVLRRYRLVASERRGSLVHYRLVHRETAQLLVVARALLLRIADDERALQAAARTLPALEVS